MSETPDQARTQVAAQAELRRAGINVTPRRTLRPRPGASLLASAQRMTSRQLQRGVGRSEAWQTDAWDMYEMVGEHRFLATTLANRMSQAQLYIGKLADDPTEDPVPVEDNPAITDILESIGSSANARAQMLQRLGVNLFVTGDGWLVGIPRHLIPVDMMTGPLSNPIVDPELIPQPDDDRIDAATLDWRMLSVSEVQAVGTQVTIRLGESAEQMITVNPDRLVMIRVWRSHPRLWWQADSPTRSTLPVLRELVGLTMRSAAEIDSRLAGAGLLIIPESAQKALQIAAGLDADDMNTDLFAAALMEAMIQPIADRASASAVVPLVVTVPDESTDLFKFMDFSKPLDEMQPERVDQAVRRLALGLDAPPELLLGTGGMNHWGAWLVLEDVVATHLEPPLALVCDAITSQYVWPVLVDQGMDPEEAQQYVCWYDVSDLVVQPTRSSDAQALHAAGAISDAALREATGFEDTDAPEVEQGGTLPPEVTMALDMIKQAPGLMAAPGLPQLVAQIRAVLAGDIPEVIDPSAPVANPTAVNGDPSQAPSNPGAAGTADTGPSLKIAPPARPQSQGAPTPGSLAAAAGAQTPIGQSLSAEPGEEPEREQPAPQDSPSAAGLCVLAQDTGRVLMIQRSMNDPNDPARGTWEFPGGGIEEGEDPFDAAVREFAEETGIVLGDLPLVMPKEGPDGTAGWTSPNGVYQGFVLEVPQEAGIQINPDHEDRATPNPDDPDGDDIETVAWMDPGHLEGFPGLRQELADDLPTVMEALAPSRVPDESGLAASAFPYRRVFKATSGDGEAKGAKDKKEPDKSKTTEDAQGRTRDWHGRWAPEDGGDEAQEGDTAALDQQILDLDKQIAALEKSSGSGGGGSGGGSSSGDSSKDKKDGDTKDGKKDDAPRPGGNVKNRTARIKGELEKISTMPAGPGRDKAIKAVQSDQADLKVLVKEARKRVAEGKQSKNDGIAGKPQDAKKDGHLDKKTAVSQADQKTIHEAKEAGAKADAAKKAAPAAKTPVTRTVTTGKATQVASPTAKTGSNTSTSSAPEGSNDGGTSAEGRPGNVQDDAPMNPDDLPEGDRPSSQEDREKALVSSVIDRWFTENEPTYNAASADPFEQARVRAALGAFLDSYDWRRQRRDSKGRWGEGIHHGPSLPDGSLGGATKALKAGEKPKVPAARPYALKGYDLHRADPAGSENWTDQQKGNYSRNLATLRNRAQESTKVSLTPEGLKGILADGRFRNVHEGVKSAGSTGSASYGATRKDYETGTMGIPASTPLAEFPVYGYKSGTKAATSYYGSITAELKPAADARTSVTFSDSMNEKARPLWQSDLDGATEGALYAATTGHGTLIQDMKTTDLDYFGYVEAQVHGGVSLKDVQSVSMSKADADSLGPALDTLKASGIKITIGGGAA